MKILHIIWSFNFGGIETMLVNIANEQVALGHEIGVLVVDAGKTNPDLVKTLDKRILLFCANRKWGAKDIFAIYRLNNLIGRFAPDVIHLHSSSLYKYLYPSFRKYCNVTLHALCTKSNTDHIEYVPRVFSISQSVAKDLMQKKGVASMVNPNGIRPELIQAKCTKTESCLFRIVQVSRLEHLKKGQHILIEAGKRLLDNGITKFAIDFIGNGDSLEYLKQLVNNNNMEEHVHFLGTKDQKYIYDNLCSYDLFVQPSIYEGFGLTVAEAMAAKVPVLVSTGQGPEEVIDGGKYGYLFKNADVEDCAAKLSMFIENMNDKSLIEKACQRVWDLYNIKVTTQTYIDNYIVRQ